MLSYLLSLLFAVLSPVHLGAAPHPATCQDTWQTDVYDTPSGDLDDGYYTDDIPFIPHATTTDPISGTTTPGRLTPIGIAHVIGHRYFSDCFDKTRRQFIVSVTQTDFTAGGPASVDLNSATVITAL